MKRQVWKYELHEGRQDFEISIDAEILAVQNQSGVVCMWVLVNPESKKETRYFEIYGTGHDIGYDIGTSREYIGTAQLGYGTLVYHIFEHKGV